MTNNNLLYNPWLMLRSVIKNRELILQLSKSQIIGRYRGSVLGLCWSFVIPLVMILIYTFVFSYIFQARWGGVEGNRAEYSIFLFSGLLIYNFFAECLTSSPSLISNNVNYVKRVVFPLEILILVSTLSSLFHFFIGFVVFFKSNQYMIIHWT
jgi:lipopolysaccharide transport system permease protein